jgi:hypothetical protein
MRKFYEIETVNVDGISTIVDGYYLDKMIDYARAMFETDMALDGETGLGYQEIFINEYDENDNFVCTTSQELELRVYA